jgi:hydroxyacylglutathione hydrolase
MMPAVHTKPRFLSPTSAAGYLSAGAVVVDGRPAAAFDAGHAAGAVNVALGDDAGELAAGLVSAGAPVIALAARPAEALWMAEELDRAGFRRVLGAVAGDHAGRALGHGPLHRSGAVDVPRLAAELATGAVLLVDVRDAGESCRGRVPGSVHLPVSSLHDAAHLLPSVPTVTACSDGRRAAAAASALRRWGHRNIWRLADGGVPDLLERPIGLDLLGAA